MMLARAVRELAHGRPVLLYDMDGREQETDMVIGAQFASPEAVATLRTEAGGLICVAIPSWAAERLGLPFLSEILKSCDSPTVRKLCSGEIPYGDLPAFSLTVNHRETYTGITDRDRSRTITELARLVDEMSRDPSGDWGSVFANRFRSPGHVHILIASPLERRRGHTELSLRLAEMAGITPATVVCEMLDLKSHAALSREQAEIYAKRHGLVLVDGEDVVSGAV